MKDKLFVMACINKTPVLNIIILLYANYRSYYIHSVNYNREALNFIKRSFFASNNRYKDHLFCLFKELT